MAKSNISKKKLKAIVFTDMADFTTISAQDEQKALDLIQKQNDIIKPIVEKHNGEWLKEIGDGLLFSFDSSLEAVRCSIAIQEKLKEFDDLNIRIGIHQGDIFIKDGDVFGDDVNIASRIEGFAPIGGISISDKVDKDIAGVSDIKTSFIGHKNLKGVEQETQIRCITSHNLPIIESSSFIPIAGYSAYFIGMVDILWNIYIIFTEPLTVDILFDYLALVYLGFIIIILGYNCFAYQKGLSKTSQRYLLNVTIILIVIHAIIPFITGYIAESIGK